MSNIRGGARRLSRWAWHEIAHSVPSAPDPPSTARDRQRPSGIERARVIGANVPPEARRLPSSPTKTIPTGDWFCHRRLLGYPEAVAVHADRTSIAASIHARSYRVNDRTGILQAAFLHRGTIAGTSSRTDHNQAQEKSEADSPHDLSSLCRIVTDRHLGREHCHLPRRIHPRRHHRRHLPDRTPD